MCNRDKGGRGWQQSGPACSSLPTDPRVAAGGRSTACARARPLLLRSASAALSLLPKLINLNAGDSVAACLQQHADAGGRHALAQPADHATCRQSVGVQAVSLLHCGKLPSPRRHCERLPRRPPPCPLTSDQHILHPACTRAPPGAASALQLSVGPLGTCLQAALKLMDAAKSRSGKQAA